MPDPGSSSSPWRVYNIGNNNPVNLMDCIEVTSTLLGLKQKKEFLLFWKPGDVPDTYADVNDLVYDFDYKPSTSLNDGIRNFVNWYKDYFKV